MVDRDTMKASVPCGHVRPADASCQAVSAPPCGRRIPGAWLIRAVAIAYLIGNGVVAYLLFAAA